MLQLFLLWAVVAELMDISATRKHESGTAGSENRSVVEEFSGLFMVCVLKDLKDHLVPPAVGRDNFH